MKTRVIFAAILLLDLADLRSLIASLSNIDSDQAQIRLLLNNVEQATEII